MSGFPLLISFSPLFLSSTKTQQKKKYEKQGYNTKKDGERDMM